MRNRISDYLAVEKSIPTGYRLRERINGQKEKILSLLGGSPQDWQDWRWQLRNRITDVDILAKIVELTPEEIEDIRRTGEKFRWAISPYYASLMDPQDPRCPIRLQAIPSIRELMDQVAAWIHGRDLTSPAPGTRRYPDRLIINVTNRAHVPSLPAAAEYRRDCRNTPARACEALTISVPIRNSRLLLTGGDAFCWTTRLWTGSVRAKGDSFGNHPPGNQDAGDHAPAGYR